jgi:predicted enzyme related to lactoylglutathione lyase
MLTTDYALGAPIWLDLSCPDTTAATTFYRAVFSWDFQSAGPKAGGYGFWQKDGKTVAALGPLTEEGTRSAWTVYFHTPDADATAKAVEQGGGTVRVEPFDVMDAGRMALLTDPGGAKFALWQPAAVTGLEAVNDTEALCWVELHTSDPTAAHSFYRSLFGWRSEQMAVPGMAYTVLSTANGDQQAASFGEIAPLQDDAQQPRWLPYFAVADPDNIVARTQENGGSVIMPAMDVPDVGRIASLADPFGAHFAIISPIVEAS